jgi:predicted transposase YbfD/YdcC
MGCQKEIAAKIVERGGDWCLALKGNQGNLHAAVAEGGLKTQSQLMGEVFR